MVGVDGERTQCVCLDGCFHRLSCLFWQKLDLELLERDKHIIGVYSFTFLTVEEFAGKVKSRDEIREEGHFGGE